jgi:hypothetical protein
MNHTAPDPKHHSACSAGARRLRSRCRFSFPCLRTARTRRSGRPPIAPANGSRWRARQAGGRSTARVSSHADYAVKPARRPACARPLLSPHGAAQAAPWASFFRVSRSLLAFSREGAERADSSRPSFASASHARGAIETCRLRRVDRRTPAVWRSDRKLHADVGREDGYTPYVVRPVLRFKAAPRGPREAWR